MVSFSYWHVLILLVSDHRQVAAFHPSSHLARMTPTQMTRLSSFNLLQPSNQRPRRRPLTSLRAAESVLAPSHSAFLVRIVALRAMAFVHFVAFLVAFRQNKALIGDSGITPARNVLHQAEERGCSKQGRRLEWRERMKSSLKKGGNGEDTRLTNAAGKFRIRRRIGEYIDRTPFLLRARERLWDRTDAMDRPVTSLLWLAKDRTKLNPWLDGISFVGMAVSLLVFTIGAANVPLVLSLWLCQRSLMAVGGIWYGYGVGTTTCRAQFPFLIFGTIAFIESSTIDASLAHCELLFRWYLFRIMMGAGLIKFRSGDKKWKQLTTMNYFYETQPVPNPITRYMHWMPTWWHRVEVLVNHFVEVVAPWLLIIPGLPPPLRRAGGVIQLVFQAVLISSGNLSFLNWLTMVPAIFCFDDAFVGTLFPQKVRSAAAVAAVQYRQSTLRRFVSLGFFSMIMALSVRVVRNLMSRHQIMNSSFDPLRLVNSYGAFGVVNESRNELVISSATSIEGPWKEYEFKAKPTDCFRRPRFISPYHYRLDWQMWIAACSRNLDRSSWIYSLLAKLLERDPTLVSLLAKDPWESEVEPPKYIRVDMYRYQFHKGKDGEQQPIPYWDREFLGRVYPRQGVASLSDVRKECQMRSF